MTEPKRWIDEGPPLAIERLLDAAQAEEPREQSLSRTLVALGVVAGTASAAATAGAATAGGVAASGKATWLYASSALVKWGLLASAVTAVGVTGRALVRSHAERAASHAPARPRAPSVAAPVHAARPASSPVQVTHSVPAASASSAAASSSASASSARIEAPPVVDTVPVTSARARRAVAPSPSLAVGPPPTAADAPVDAERLAEEVALVDQARGALAQGDARAALAALDTYATRFAQRRFAPESLYLRMESLLELGRPADARTVAARLASGYPKSPQAARARQVLSAIP